MLKSLLYPVFLAVILAVDSINTGSISEPLRDASDLSDKFMNFIISSATTGKESHLCVLEDDSSEAETSLKEILGIVPESSLPTESSEESIGDRAIIAPESGDLWNEVRQQYASINLDEHSNLYEKMLDELLTIHDSFCADESGYAEKLSEILHKYFNKLYDLKNRYQRGVILLKVTCKYVKKYVIGKDHTHSVLSKSRDSRLRLLWVHLSKLLTSTPDSQRYITQQYLDLVAQTLKYDQANPQDKKSLKKVGKCMFEKDAAYLKKTEKSGFLLRIREAIVTLFIQKDEENVCKKLAELSGIDELPGRMCELFKRVINDPSIDTQQIELYENFFSTEMISPRLSCAVRTYQLKNEGYYLSRSVASEDRFRDFDDLKRLRFLLAVAKMTRNYLRNRDDKKYLKTLEARQKISVCHNARLYRMPRSKTMAQFTVQSTANNPLFSVVIDQEKCIEKIEPTDQKECLELKQ